MCYYYSMSRTSGPRFTESHLDEILTFFEENLPGEMPNALMSELTRHLMAKKLISKGVDTDPDTSDFIHSYETELDDESECSSVCSGSSCSSQSTFKPPPPPPKDKKKKHKEGESPKHKESPKTKAPPKHHTCKGKKADGTPCSFKAINGHYCGFHSK